ncbi:MAG: OTU domain-containing protein, partial [bacterium]
IISNVCKWECGKQIFKEMVLGLKDKNVALVLCNKPDNLGLDKRLFLLSDPLFNEIRNKKGDNRFLLLLDLYSNPLISHCRWCAVMNIVTKKIEIQKLDLKDLSHLPAEGCSAGHEFYHVCTFLEKIDEKQNEADIPQKAKEKSTQEKSLFSPLGLMVQRFDATSCLLSNGEDMRNLCGLKIQEGKIVESPGEFDFWQQALINCPGYKDLLVLPLYCDVNTHAPVLADKSNAILHQLFQIKFPNCPHMPTINASYILGTDFSSFSLIDVPGDGNCGISAVLVASRQMGENFSILDDGHLSLTPEQREQVMGLRGRATECIPLLHARGIEISTRLIREGSWIDGEDFAFIARAIQQPIVLIQVATEGSLPYTMTRFTIEGNEEILTNQTPEQLLTNNPRTLFIYFNGVNHFQALLPKTKEEIQAEEEQREAKIAKMAEKDEEKGKPLDQKEGGCIIS